MGNGNPEGKPADTAPAAAPQSQAPASGQSDGGFKIPEKFAGKSTEDVVKAYVELEKKLGTNDGWSKLNDLGGTPEQIREAVQWARNTYGRMTKGELIEAAQARLEQQQNQSQQSSTLPWESNDWEYRPAKEQAAAISQYVKEQNEAFIKNVADQYGQQFNQFRQQQGAESTVMLEAITRAIKSGKDPATIMTLAAELRSKTPTELMDMALKNLTADSDRDKEINDKVAAEISRLRQEDDNKRLALESGEPVGARPRFISKNPKSADTNKKIIADLRKKGINI